MKAIGFELVKVTKESTGEILTKIRVKFDTCVSINLLIPEKSSVEEMKGLILANRDNYLRKVQVYEAIGSDGKPFKYARFTNAEIEEEF